MTEPTVYTPVADGLSAPGSYQPVEFIVYGSRVRGRLYLPTDAAGPVPGVVLAHGWTMLTGGDIERSAQRFLEAGFAALTFDYRHLGHSEGEPRQEVNPYEQIEDIRCAISYMQSREEVDEERIGLWGASYSGAHAIAVAAVDKRLKAVVAQTPAISLLEAQMRNSPANIAGVRAAYEADRANQIMGGDPVVIPQISENPAAAVAWPGEDSWNYMGSQTANSPLWKNEVTLRSLELTLGYDPAHLIDRIAPTPLLYIVTMNDTQVPTDLQLRAYEKAVQPKELVTVPGGHYAVYRDQFEPVTVAAVDFFLRTL